MDARIWRSALAALVAVTAVLALPAAPPAGADEPDIPYFTVTSGGDLDQPVTANRPALYLFRAGYGRYRRR